MRLVLLFLAVSAACFGARKKRDPMTIDPWFTGPILAPSGHVVEGPHTNWEPYIFVTDNIGIYNHKGRHVGGHQNTTVNPLLSLSQGLTKWMDLQVIPQLIYNTKGDQSSWNVGDFTAYLGFQIMSEKPGSWTPDCRFTLDFTFPTGKFKNLNPDKLGTDSTGAGSVQLGLGPNFQKMWRIFGGHPFRVRLSVLGTFPIDCTVKGFNSYGGGFGTSGKLHLGNRLNTILAFEYMFSQHWNLAVDFEWIMSAATTFTGFAGRKADGTPATVGAAPYYQFSIAPGIEYNFNSSLGILLGAWFSASGQDTLDFTSGVLAVNYYH